MFRAVGRRLALLNALVVLAILAAVGTATYLYLSRQIEAEIDNELASRAAAVAVLWSDSFTVDESASDSEVVQLALRLSDDESSGSGNEDENHEEDELAEELVRSGDTIAFGFSLDGQLVADLRGIEVQGLPLNESVQRALSGRTAVDTVEIDGDEIRLFSTPVFREGEVIGAVQVGMGLGPRMEMLAFVRRASIGGLLLGMLLAVPSGLFLAQRSMRPIRDAFVRQQAFVADAAHELRTPLTLVRAEAEYLQRTPDLSSEDREDGQRRIVEEVDGMSNLVSNLLLLARSDGSALPLDRELVDLADIARTTFARFDDLASERQVTMRLDAPEQVPARVDPRAIEQALGVLVDNALTYTPAGGWIQITARRGEQRSEIEVEDNGIGIEAHDLNRIFDRFYRADQARSRETGGSGLGLSIAKSLIEAHGGSLSVRSDVGHGAKFVMTLPHSDV